MSIVDDAQALGFDYCQRCDLIWCDKMGLTETACPRCFYGDACDKVIDDLDALREECETSGERCAELENKLDSMDNLIEDMRNL